MMDETREKRRRVWSAAIVAALMVAGCGKPERAEPFTRLGEFYVGMPWEEATKYLGDDVEVHKFGILYKEDPKRGEPVYGVRDEDKNVALMLDNSKTIIRIDKIDLSRNEDN